MIFPPEAGSSVSALYEGVSRRWWTYGELREAVAEMSETLAFPAKALVFDFCRNDIRSIVTYLAAVQTGHTVALLDGATAAEPRAALIGTYEPEFILRARPIFPCPATSKSANRSGAEIRPLRTLVRMPRSIRTSRYCSPHPGAPEAPASSASPTGTSKPMPNPSVRFSASLRKIARLPACPSIILRPFRPEHAFAERGTHRPDRSRTARTGLLGNLPRR